MVQLSNVDGHDSTADDSIPILNADYFSEVLFDVNSGDVDFGLPVSFEIDQHTPLQTLHRSIDSEISRDHVNLADSQHDSQLDFASPSSIVSTNEIIIGHEAVTTRKRKLSDVLKQGKAPTASVTNEPSVKPQASTRSSTAPLEIKKMTDIKARACDECRRRKTACYYLNSENSRCFRCQMENIDCTFSVKNRSNDQNGSNSGSKQLPIPQRSKQSLSSITGPIEDYSQLPGRSLLKKTLSLQHPRSSFSIGQYGLWDQRVLESIELDKSNQAQVSPNLSLRRVDTDCWFMVRSEGGQHERSNDCDNIEKLVHPYGRSLVNAFFMFFQPEYPVLHEKIFVEKYLRTYRELMPALLGAVYLLGMRWWNHSLELSTVPKPENIVATLYDLTLSIFFKASGGSSLSVIQAGLLLLQCSYSDPRHLSICSIINAVSYRNALNRICLHWRLPRWEINLRIRLSWATHSQSTWTSLFESIPPLIQDSSWYLSPLNPDMFDSGSNEVSHNGFLFIELNKLSLIVHDMHNLLSSQLLMMYSSEVSAQQATANNANVNTTKDSKLEFDRNAKSSKRAQSASSVNHTPVSPSARGTSRLPADEVLDLIKPIQLRLHQWYSKLPQALVNVEGDSPSGSFTLRIAYIAAEVTLHRFIIRSICSEKKPSYLDPNILGFLRDSARERLDVALSLLQRLKPQHFQQFWYFAASRQLAVIGVFAALMYTTSETKSEADYYRKLLRDYINIIQIFSDNEVMSAALRTLRSSIAGVPGLEF